MHGRFKSTPLRIRITIPPQAGKTKFSLSIKSIFHESLFFLFLKCVVVNSPHVLSSKTIISVLIDALSPTLPTMFLHVHGHFDSPPRGMQINILPEMRGKIIAYVKQSLLFMVCNQ